MASVTSDDIRPQRRSKIRFLMNAAVFCTTLAANCLSQLCLGDRYQAGGRQSSAGIPRSSVILTGGLKTMILGWPSVKRSRSADCALAFFHPLTFLQNPHSQILCWLVTPAHTNDTNAPLKCPLQLVEGFCELFSTIGGTLVRKTSRVCLLPRGRLRPGMTTVTTLPPRNGSLFYVCWR